MVRIYLAGKFEDKMDIGAKMQILRDMGHEITHDWTSFESDQDSIEKMAVSAELDINGVANADLCIFLMTDPTYAYRGTFTELGAALALQKRCVIVCHDHGSYCASNCFFHHPRIQHLPHWNHVLHFLE